jgi:hypothetical protein
LEKMFPSEIIHSAVIHRNYMYCICGGPWSESVLINLALKIYHCKDFKFVYQPEIYASNGHSGVSYAIEVSKCNKYLFTSAFQPGFAIGIPRGSTVKQWELLNSGAMVQLLHEYVNITPEAIFKIQIMSSDQVMVVDQGGNWASIDHSTKKISRSGLSNLLKNSEDARNEVVTWEYFPGDVEKEMKDYVIFANKKDLYSLPMGSLQMSRVGPRQLHVLPSAKMDEYLASEGPKTTNL